MAANGAAARVCHVRKTADFDGYGFNLHAEKGKPGQYVGKVDAGSPAEAAGLRPGDRILEVNGRAIAGESHKQVVARIKERPDEAELLVAPPRPGDRILEVNGRAIAGESHKQVVARIKERPDEAELLVAPPRPGDPLPDLHAEPTDPSPAAPLAAPPAPAPALDLHMTAAEMRARLAARKRADPKQLPMDLKSKFDIVKKL